MKAGSGIATLGLPDTQGVPKSFAETTIAVPFNDLDQVASVFRERGERIAAVIVEPVAGNMGCVPPLGGFLEGLRAITAQYGALLIFDEVMTGFRLAYGGAQSLYGIQPDLTMLGKIVGGGLPLAAYGGRAEIMKKVAPAGPVYQAGTLAGNPVAVAAGVATLQYLKTHPDVYDTMETLMQELMADVPSCISTNRVGSMHTFFFQAEQVRDYEDAKASDTAAFGRFFHHLLERGVYVPPSQFESGFLSAAHTPEDIAHTKSAIAEFFRSAATTSGVLQ